MGDTYNCIKEGALAEIRTEVDALKQEVSSLKKLYNLISDQTNSISVLTERIARVNDDIKVIKNDVEYIKSIPKSRYNQIVTSIINVTIGLLLGYLFTKGMG